MILSLSRLPPDPPQNDRAERHPVHVFAEWLSEVKQAGAKEPAAVCLATATLCGAPSCRMVLLKEHNEQGFVVYTNSQSRKGRDMEANPQAALCFYWPELNKQVRVEGYVNNVSDEEADAYFATRSLKARIGAWASKQSEPMKEKGELAKRIAYYGAKWAMGQVERPPYWKGFRIVPDYVEFWAEGAHRIHERKVYYLREDHWYVAMLYP